MSETDTLVATPGWFPDPAAENRMRWWDGTAWTDHFVDYAPASPGLALAAGRAAAVAARSRRELRAQVGPLTYGELGDELQPSGSGRRARAAYAFPSVNRTSA